MGISSTTLFMSFLLVTCATASVLLTTMDDMKEKSSDAVIDVMDALFNNLRVVDVLGDKWCNTTSATGDKTCKEDSISGGAIADTRIVKVLIIKATLDYAATYVDLNTLVMYIYTANWVRSFDLNATSLLGADNYSMNTPVNMYDKKCRIRALRDLDGSITSGILNDGDLIEIYIDLFFEGYSLQDDEVFTVEFINSNGCVHRERFIPMPTKGYYTRYVFYI